jgi:hypothetical protein
MNLEMHINTFTLSLCHLFPTINRGWAAKERGKKFTAAAYNNLNLKILSQLSVTTKSQISKSTTISTPQQHSQLSTTPNPLHTNTKPHTHTHNIRNEKRKRKEEEQNRERKGREAEKERKK